jgi:hypothetical protein
MALLALPIAFDPVRLGFNILLVSRSRPAQNLLAYWVGCLAGGLLLLLVPILLLHFTPRFSGFAHDLADPATSVSSVVRDLEIAAGAVLLSATTLMALRLFARQRAPVPAGDADTSSVVVDDSPPNPVSRLLSRANTAWESGALWVALAIGVFASPNPAMVVFGLTTIPTSGASIGVQIGAAIVFVVETMALLEIVLVGSLIAPTKTERLLRWLHDWARAYRWQILIIMLTLVGLALVAQGMGAI